MSDVTTTLVAPGEHPEAVELRKLARAYQLDSSPLLTRRLLEIADRLDRAHRWVSFGCDGLDEHQIADAARDAAASELLACRDQAPDGWPEETDTIWWGSVYVHERVVEIARRPRDPEVDYHGNWDEWIDYALRPVGGSK